MALSSQREAEARTMDSRASSGEEQGVLRVRVLVGAGKTLKVTSVRMPKRPREPTKNFGRSNPAAFLTTCPPAR